MDDIFLTADPTPTVCPYRITQVYYLDIPRLSGDHGPATGVSVKRRRSMIMSCSSCLTASYAVLRPTTAVNAG